jgi:hypothetical protein
VSVKTAKKVKPIIVQLNHGKADFPEYIKRAQRHLEKGQFIPQWKGTTWGYQVPTDILRLTLDSKLVDQIEEVVLVYINKSNTVR